MSRNDVGVLRIIVARYVLGYFVYFMLNRYIETDLQIAQKLEEITLQPLNSLNHDD